MRSRRVNMEVIKFGVKHNFGISIFRSVLSSIALGIYGLCCNDELGIKTIRYQAVIMPCVFLSLAWIFAPEGLIKGHSRESWALLLAWGLVAVSGILVEMFRRGGGKKIISVLNV